jgi:hypothetical protein
MISNRRKKGISGKITGMNERVGAVKKALNGTLRD